MRKYIRTYQFFFLMRYIWSPCHNQLCYWANLLSLKPHCVVRAAFFLWGFNCFPVAIILAIVNMWHGSLRFAIVGAYCYPGSQLKVLSGQLNLYYPPPFGNVK